jgi:hypothetical protein
MTAESRNSPLLENGLLGTFPLQLIRNQRVATKSTHVSMECDFLQTDLVRNAFSMSTDKQQIFSMVTAGQYKEPSREEQIHLVWRRGRIPPP